MADKYLIFRPNNNTPQQFLNQWNDILENHVFLSNFCYKFNQEHDMKSIEINYRYRSECLINSNMRFLGKEIRNDELLFYIYDGLLEKWEIEELIKFIDCFIEYLDYNLSKYIKGFIYIT